MEDKTNENIVDERYYTQEIFDLIRKTPDKEKLANALSYYHDNDIASVLGYLTPQERRHLYESIGLEDTSRIFAYLDEDFDKYFAELEADQAADILEEMDADDAVDILEGLNDKKAKEIIELIEPEAKEDIELINSYADNQFGSLMTTNFIAIRYGLTKKEAMESLVRQAEDNDNIGTVYLLNENETLHGAIDLRDLLTAKTDEDIENCVITSYPYVYADEIIDDESLDKLVDYDEDSIPVLSEKTNELLGVITAQDLAEISFEDLDEPEEIEDPIETKEKKNTVYLHVLGMLCLLTAAFAGYGADRSDVLRQTLFILMLVLGVGITSVGLYMTNRELK